jgi:hypothetical protein
MIVRNILPRALQRLAVIEAEAPVREAAALMSKPIPILSLYAITGDMVGVLTNTGIVGQIESLHGCRPHNDVHLRRQRTFWKEYQCPVKSQTTPARSSSVNRRYRDGRTKAGPLVPSWLRRPTKNKFQIRK